MAFKFQGNTIIFLLYLLASKVVAEVCFTTQLFPGLPWLETAVKIKVH